MSDWKQSAAKRRDERHTKTEAISPGRGKSKDTKRWCRGKVGKEHTPKCMTHDEAKGETIYPSGRKATGLSQWRYLVCTTCGRELAVWFPTRWSKKPENKPAWVTC